jgi:hypothetical protein
MMKIITSINTPTIPSMIVGDTWKIKFKTWKESTTTSSSGLHLGHDKALIRNIYKTQETTFEINEEAAHKQYHLFQCNPYHDKYDNNNTNSHFTLEKFYQHNHTEEKKS